MAASQEQQVHYTEEKPIVSPGNPVFTCKMTPETNSQLSGQQAKQQNLLYRTTSNDYGLLSPTIETSPYSYHPKRSRFTENLNKAGMHRDTSLNTSLDRSRVIDCPNLQHTINN
ncbi:uncharacterized protein C15orf65-like [Thalassophryne amazonica]|uniref:uncharacterized protein C15orf65-like n=1 Tax=Thalassophryne amazonica TaxID=390379 RepID=UPI001471F848|nr:uncharacterized protein C15orf65-like [Thalassophryne amazonica]